jgi:pimeloyl-ACP methyl ester carboxylesterase
MTEAVPVRRVGDNTLRTLTVPVVFVPGVMGSRLRLGADDHWDPDSNGNMIGWATNRAETTRRLLSPDTGGAVMDTAGKKVPADRLPRGWGGVSWRFYGQFLQDLEAQRFGSVSTPVYAVGYDWRQDNRVSGRAVAARIGEILQEWGAERYILVSHSMGGLVTRAMLMQDAGVAGKAMGVVHIAQPALGAAVFYRRMFTGARAGPDGGTFSPSGIVLRNILGTSRESFQTILSALPGPMQLMVTPQYRDARRPPGEPISTKGTPVPWLSITPFETAVRQDVESVSWGTYLQPDSPPGLLAAPNEWYALSPARAEDMQARIGDAQVLHKALVEYGKHPKTWAIFGDGLETDMGARFELPPRSDRDYHFLSGAGGPHGGGAHGYTARRSDGRTFYYPRMNPDDRGLALVRREEGDGTVPAPSARALFPEEAHAVEAGTDYAQKRQFRVTGDAAEHDKICHHPEAERCLFDIMQHVLGGGV